LILSGVILLFDLVTLGGSQFGFLGFAVLIATFSVLGIIAYLSNRSLSNFHSQLSNLLMRGAHLRAKGTDIDTLEKSIRETQRSVKEVSDELQGSWKLLQRDLDLQSKKVETGLAEAMSLLKSKSETIIKPKIDLYDEGELKESRSKRDKLQVRIDHLTKQLENHKSLLSEFQNMFDRLRISNLVEIEDDIILTSLESLKKILPSLRSFYSTIKSDAKIAGSAIHILDKILLEETAKISDLFKREGTASRLFSKITTNRYGTIEFDSSTGSLIVTKPNGEKLDVSKLSRGATDQLYLSVRLCLAEKVLDGVKGFLIIDDAFLSSDIHRIAEQVTILKDISDSGWQVIYFTTKSDTFKAFKKISASSPIILDILP